MCDPAFSDTKYSVREKVGTMTDRFYIQIIKCKFAYFACFV